MRGVVCSCAAATIPGPGVTAEPGIANTKANTGSSVTSHAPFSVTAGSAREDLVGYVLNEL